MYDNPVEEARRQLQICNACRYCEGYCSVFPAVHRERSFSDGDISQFANLCHNCRGCYYACQYTEPHEFAINLPAALAEVRHDSWQEHAIPQGVSRAFQRSGVAIAAATALGFALLFWIARSLGQNPDAEGFYQVLSHNMMVAIFAPAFLLPIVSIAVSLRRYWRSVGGERVALADVVQACRDAAGMRNLKGGHGDGCNFEDEDRFSHARRHAHHATMYGFLLCFASTSTGTILHYGFGIKAPYDLVSLPKLFGITGGVLLSAGTLALLWLKLRAERGLSDMRAWGGEIGFIVLLHFVSTSGLVLYAVTGTGAVPVLLALHLGAVLAFFLLTPYSKMAHGFYRMAALTREAQNRRRIAEAAAQPNGSVSSSELRT